MDIIALLVITAVVAVGGLWMVSRENPPTDPKSETK